MLMIQYFINTSSNSANIVVDMNQQALDKVFNWCSQNRLSLNIKKTKHMIIKSNRETHPGQHNSSNVYVNNLELENVSSYNYLGVVVDDHLGFSDCVDQKRRSICAYIN